MKSEELDQKYVNKRKTILIDCDDTLNNLLEKWIEIYNEKYNDNLDYKTIKMFDISSYVKEECGKDVYNLLKTKGLFSDMVTPLKNSVEVTEFLSKFYELYIVTYCVYPENIIEKYKFFEKHFPHISTQNIITCRNKGLIKGDYLIDDYYENLRHFKNGKIMFNNKFHLEGTDFNAENVISVKNWDEILVYFTVNISSKK